MKNPIFHIAKRSEWERSIVEYVADSLKTEKFIHCSTQSQVPIVANTFYKGQTDLVLLKINPSKLKANLQFEEPSMALQGVPKNDKFPHVYGAINKDAVEEALDFLPDQSGKFHFPK